MFIKFYTVIFAFIVLSLNSFVYAQPAPQLWSFNATTAIPVTNYNTKIEKLDDLNSDGVPEVLVQFSWTGKRVFVFNGKTGTIPLWQIDDPDMSYLGPAERDFNGDGKRDLFFAKGPGFYKNQLAAVSVIDGSTIGSITILGAGPGGPLLTIYAAKVIGDLASGSDPAAPPVSGFGVATTAIVRDGPGVVVSYFGNGFGLNRPYLKKVDYSGSQKWMLDLQQALGLSGYPTFNQIQTLPAESGVTSDIAISGSFAGSVAVIHDNQTSGTVTWKNLSLFNLSGVIKNGPSLQLVLNSKGAVTLVDAARGAVSWTKPSASCSYFTNSLTVPDISSDSVSDVLTIGTSNGNVSCLTQSVVVLDSQQGGTEKVHYDISLSYSDSLLADSNRDMNADGKPDLVVASTPVSATSGKVYILDGAVSSTIASYDLPYAKSVAGLGTDVGSDGIPDFVVASGDGYVYSIGQ